jgi:hypothetical protein
MHATPTRRRRAARVGGRRRRGNRGAAHTAAVQPASPSLTPIVHPSVVLQAAAMISLFEAPTYADVITRTRSASTIEAFGRSGLTINNYVPASLVAGEVMMCRAQTDLNWKKTLASSERGAAIEALEKEIAAVERNALTRLEPAHPEYARARAEATPGRVILSRKRGGQLKARAVARGDLQEKELLDGEGFRYFTAASQALALRSLLFRGRRAPDHVEGTIDVTAAFTQTHPFPPDAPPRYVYFTDPVTKTRLYFRQRTNIYGECSAPRRWADTLGDHLRSIGFTPGQNDSTVWHSSGINVSLIVHTDDIFFSGPRTGVDTFLSELKLRLEVKDPQFLTPRTPIDFLGFWIAVDANNVYISCESYVRQTLEVLEDDFPDVYAYSTPFEGSIEGGAPLSSYQTRRYVMAVGALGWVCGARPDVCFAFSRLSQHLSAPTTAAWSALRRVVGYLKANPSLCIGQSLHIDNPGWEFFTDSDYGGNTEPQNKMKPQLGIVTTCGGAPIFYASKHSKVCFAHPRLTEAHADISVAGSEIYALGNGTADFLGLSYVVEELGLPSIPLPLPIQVDNTTAKAFANGTVKRSKIKHIDQRLMFVRALRDADVVDVRHVRTGDNLADFFTKALPPAPFAGLRARLMLAPPADLLGSSANSSP